MNPEQEAKRVIRGGLAVIVVGALAMGLWGFWAPLSGAIIAPGFVKVDLNRKVVQHQEGGIVRAVRVRDGDRVTQGQELVVLDDVRIDSQLDLLRTQLDAERAKVARLEAERTFAARPDFPKDLVKKEFVSREDALFRARREALDSQVAVLRKQIRETVEEVGALSVQIGAEDRALKLQKDELEANERLLEKGYVQKTRLLALQRGVAEYEARHAEERA